MRKGWYAVLTAGLFLLLLSSLVVTPDAPTVSAAPPLPADARAVFRPLISAAPPQASPSPSRCEVCVFLAVLPLLVTGMVCDTIVRDANGRILRAARYENSVYQLFRAEIAGG